jgi:hypothetical protein
VKWAILAALWIALGLLAPEARAQGERPLIVLLLPERESPTARRLIAEIGELGASFRVLQIADDLDTSSEGLAQLAELQGASTVVLLDEQERSATLWFDDGEQRRVTSGAGSAEVRTDAVVVGTLEVLRARLRREPKPKPETRDEPTPDTEPEPLDNPTLPTPQSEPGPLIFGAVIGLDRGGPEFTWSSSFQLNIDLALASSLHLRALLRVPMASARADAPGASAEIKPLLTAGGFALGGELTSGWWFDYHLGAGAAHVVAEGFSEIPASTRSVDRWLFVVVSGVHTSWRLNSVMSLTLHAAAALAPAPVEVYVNEQRIATWGRPAAMTGVGLEFRPAFF